MPLLGQHGKASQARTDDRGGIFPVCANPNCTASWTGLWRRREGPVFEGRRTCSEPCSASRVEAALFREMDARGGDYEPHRHRIPLGLAMLELGWITQSQLRSALAAQKSAGAGRLGEWLVRQGGASEEQVTRAVGLQWGCPVLNTEIDHPQSLTPLVPRLFVDAFRALPLRLAAGKILYLGFEDRLDAALALALERMTGLRVECGVVEEASFRQAHAFLLEAAFPRTELIEASAEPALAAALAKAIERARPVESRLVRVHDCLWLRMWLRRQQGPLPDLNSVLDVIASTGLR